MPTAHHVASLFGPMACATITDVTRENLVEAAAEFRRRKDEFDLARKKLAEAMVAAAHAGMPQTEIIQISGYNREHVRRVLRAGGVERKTTGTAEDDQ